MILPNASYRVKETRAGEGNRTPTGCLEGTSSAVELHPRVFLPACFFPSSLDVPGATCVTFRTPPGYMIRQRHNYLAHHSRHVATTGVEPVASRFSGGRSFQLSYAAVELEGFEPSASCVPRKRSTDLS